ncbi:hypothetical protein HG442_002285, partial [Candidatus Gracilibacteria bacterium]|nr:hypothetical protein [Candidatus Gracilibacteria bacterium]
SDLGDVKVHTVVGVPAGSGKFILKKREKSKEFSRKNHKKVIKNIFPLKIAKNQVKKIFFERKILQKLAKKLRIFATKIFSKLLYTIFEQKNKI